VQGGDGDFVARLGAVGELLRDLDGKCAVGQQHVGRLTVKRAPNRDRGAGPHCFADQVVSECQPIADLSEDVSLDKFLDRVNQLRDRQLGQLGQLVDGESPAQRRRERRHPVCGRGHPQQPNTHVVTDASWHPVFEEPRPAGFDSHHAFGLQAAEELDKQERVSPNLIGFPQKFTVRLSTQDVGGDLDDGLTPERAEPDHLGPGVFQLVLDALQQRRALVRAGRHHPADGQGGKLPR
jgi:hypothetical protein